MQLATQHESLKSKSKKTPWKKTKTVREQNNQTIEKSKSKKIRVKVKKTVSTKSPPPQKKVKRESW